MAFEVVTFKRIFVVPLLEGESAEGIIIFYDSSV